MITIMFINLKLYHNWEKLSKTGETNENRQQKKKPTIYIAIEIYHICFNSYQYEWKSKHNKIIEGESFNVFLWHFLKIISNVGLST